MGGFRGDDEDAMDRAHRDFRNVLDLSWRDPLILRPVTRVSSKGDARVRPNRFRKRRMTKPPDKPKPF